MIENVPGYELLAWDGRCGCKPLMPGTVQYSEECDAHWCTACDMWLESKCLDPTCPYCLQRNEQPSSINN